MPTKTAKVAAKHQRREHRFIKKHRLCPECGGQLRMRYAAAKCPACSLEWRLNIFWRRWPDRR